MLIALLTLFVADAIQRLNAVKIVLTGLANGFRVEAERTVDSLDVDAFLVKAGASGPFVGATPFAPVDLQRIAAGVYGRCEFCGNKISEARLNALPYTNSCIDCQRENERHGQAFGRSPEDTRWAKIYDKPSDDHERDSEINLSDFEMDLSESGAKPCPGPEPMM